MTGVPPDDFRADKLVQYFKFRGGGLGWKSLAAKSHFNEQLAHSNINQQFSISRVLLRTTIKFKSHLNSARSNIKIWLDVPRIALDYPTKELGEQMLVLISVFGHKCPVRKVGFDSF